MRNKLYIALAMLLSFGASCTDLEENVLDEASITGQTDKQVADGLIAPVYARLPDIYRHTTLFALSEISTDEAILPYRGGTDWGDNGIYLSLHRHQVGTTDPNVRDTWNLITQSISRSVIALYTLPDNKDPNAKVYLAEAKAMRAWYNMLALDLWGIAFVKEKPDDVSTIIRGQEAIDYIQSELLAAEPNLETNVTTGRVSKAAAWGMLAKLHLNAAAWRDIYAASYTFKPEDMDKVIDYTSRIISSGTYSLSPDYFSIFGDANNTNKELVFTVDQRFDLNGHNRLAYFSLSGDQFPLPQFAGANGTDGPAITPDFYQTWTDFYGATDPAQADPRFYKKNVNVPASGVDTFYTAADYKIDRGILRGQQYGLIRVSGAFVKDAQGRFKVGKLFNVTRSRPTAPVDHTLQVNFTTAGSDYSTGYRVEKYEFSAKSSSGRNFGEADIAIIRLGDVYLMRAEAKLRKGDAAGALADVNAVRTSRRSGSLQAPALTSLNLDGLFRERGFELYWEFQRRTDMIRFGKYEGLWTEKTNTDKNMRLMPIPQTAIDGSSNLVGYLKQNPGY